MKRAKRLTKKRRLVALLRYADWAFEYFMAHAYEPDFHD